MRENGQGCGAASNESRADPDLAIAQGVSALGQIVGINVRSSLPLDSEIDVNTFKVQYLTPKLPGSSTYDWCDARLEIKLKSPLGRRPNSFRLLQTAFVWSLVN